MTDNIIVRGYLFIKLVSMMFYLDNLIDPNKSNTEQIITILRARGFLIEFVNGRYYVSDNASIQDVQYLEKQLEVYHIGKIYNPKDYTTGSRRNWSKYACSRSIQYETIKPQTIELIVSEEASVENAICLFESMGRNGSEAGITIRKWSQFAQEVTGEKPCIAGLESYVAYYVKAISACGVYTCFSCDGNHEQGGKVYVYSDYPSNIWHELLWKNIVCRIFGDIPFIGEGIIFTNPISQKKIYRDVFEIADYLYSNRIPIRKIKEKTMNRLTKRIIHELSPKDIESYYRQVCEAILLNDDLIFQILR